MVFSGYDYHSDGPLAILPHGAASAQWAEKNPDNSRKGENHEVLESEP